MLIRNTLYNLLGLGLPLLVAIGSMPVLIQSLGDARFGVLTLIWAVVSYFGLFDLGLGRALTQQLSVLIAEKREHDIPPLVYTSLFLLTGLGVSAGVLMWWGAAWGVQRISYSGDINEIVGRDFGLTQDSRECSDFDFAMHRNHAALWPAPHDYVATGLANFYETQTLKCFDDRRTGGARQLRHAMED